MFSNLGHLMANIFVGFQNIQMFDKVLKAYCYLRYVDDNFASFTLHSEANRFFHTFLQFTMAEEKKVTFLRVLVQKTSTSFVTSVYRKPTFTDLCLSWNPFDPRSWTINLIKTLIHRALVLNTKCKLDAERKTPTFIAQMATLKVF